MADNSIVKRSIEEGNSVRGGRSLYMQVGRSQLIRLHKQGDRNV